MMLVMIRIFIFFIWVNQLISTADAVRIGIQGKKLCPSQGSASGWDHGQVNEVPELEPQAAHSALTEDTLEIVRDA